MASISSFVEAQMEQTAVFDTHASPRDSLLIALDELLGLTDGLLPAGERSDLIAARARVAEDRFNLVVLGEFKRGKSTLINALLEREVLPTSVVPLTSVVTAIRGGDSDRLLIHYEDGREQAAPLAKLADYVTEAGNPGNRLHVELVRVELEHELLGTGLELVDTPGIGSIHSHNTEAAKRFLPRVDAALCVLDAGQPLSAGERELFADVARRAPRLIMVVNKLDQLDPPDRTTALEFVRGALRNLLPHDGSELFAVSARSGEGIPPLLERLRRLAGEERGVLLVRSVVALARSFAAGGAQTARFEARALEMPLDELTARARVFDERIRDLRAASAEAGALLERGIETMLTEEVNLPLTHHARREEFRLRSALREHADELPHNSPRELSRELEEWVDVTVRGEFDQLVPRFESLIADRLGKLERRYADRVQRILEEVHDVAEDVFGARAGEMLPEAGLRTPSRFSFKLKDVEHALDILVGFGRTVTPGALGRKIVLREADRRLMEMTDRHAGRLRSELVTRATEAGRIYRRELAAAVEEAIEAIQAAVERATRDHQRGEDRSRARLHELALTENRCRELAAQLDRC